MFVYCEPKKVMSLPWGEEKRLGSLTQMCSLAEHTWSVQNVGEVAVVCNYNLQGKGQVHPQVHDCCNVATLGVTAVESW